MYGDVSSNTNMFETFLTVVRGLFRFRMFDSCITNAVNIRAE